MNHFHDPVMFAKKFDAPERDVWQKPDQVISTLNLNDSEIVVDVGSGTGYFSVRLSKQLKNGKVIALDESPQMVEYLKNRASDLSLANIDPRIASIDGKINLQEKVDLLMYVDVYHHIVDRSKYFSSLSERLNQDGRIVIIDRADTSPNGPPLTHRVSPVIVEKEMRDAGYKLVERHEFLLPYQYFLIFCPSPSHL